MSKYNNYCHFYHANGHCFKGMNCKFLHGKRKTPCPNNDKCPIKSCAEEFRLQNKSFTSIEPVLKKDILLPKNQRITVEIKKQKNEKNENIHVLGSEKQVNFQSELSGWDEMPSFNPAASLTKIIEIENEERKKNIDLEKKEKDLEKNKKSKKVKIQENVDPGEEISRKNFLKIFSQMQSDIKQFLPQYQKVNNLSLDLMFIVDCTSSMNSWIRAVKNEIIDIVEEIKSNSPVDIINFSFIGYRDYDCDKDERFEIFTFSPNLENFQKFLGNVITIGGGDIAEDVVGGFYQANQQQWSSVARYAVMIADAPAHGKKYHSFQDFSSDNYPNGDPDGLDLEQEVKNLLKKDVCLHVIQISQATKIMFQLMNDYNQEVTCKPLQIIELGQSTEYFSQNIAKTIHNTVSATVTKCSVTQELSLFKAINQLNVTEINTITDNFPNLQQLSKDINMKLLKSYSGNHKKSSGYNRNYYENEENAQFNNIQTRNLTFNITSQQYFPSLESSKEMDSICHTYFIVKKRGEAIDWRKNLLQYSFINTKICIEDAPFAEGAMRYSFFAKDTSLDQKLVVKLNKKQYEGNDELNKERLIRDLESQFICQHIVNEFNNRFSFLRYAGSNLINFVHCFIYEIKSPLSNQHRYYAAENYISGKYVKFNNNSGWCSRKQDDSVLLSQTLSHFSYQITEGYLMVVDLQGVQGLYTDPQIHCLDMKRFGSGNLGYEGMFKFFLSHQCNRYCREMGLVHPTSENLDPIEDFYSSFIQEPIDKNKIINCICDLCKDQFPAKCSYLYDRITTDMEKYCVPCNEKRKNSIIEAPCSKCDDYFNYSEYWYLMKRTERPERCVPCRKIRKIKS